MKRITKTKFSTKFIQIIYDSLGIKSIEKAYSFLKSIESNKVKFIDIPVEDLIKEIKEYHINYGTDIITKDNCYDERIYEFSKSLNIFTYKDLKKFILNTNNNLAVNRIRVNTVRIFLGIKK